MKKCDFCGREIKKPIRMYGHNYCKKHMHQQLKYGKVLDNNPRTQNDLNEFRIDGDTVYISVYNQKNEKIGEFFIDLEDFKKIKYKKWRQEPKGYIVTGNNTKSNPTKRLPWILLNLKDPNKVVDHKDGNPLNNKKENLRICSQSENKLNISYMSSNTSGVIGVNYDKSRGKWTAEIRKGYIRCHLKRWDTKEEAIYARLIASEILFKGFQNTGNREEMIRLTKSLPESKKSEIKEYVLNKIKDKYTLGN